MSTRVGVGVLLLRRGCRRPMLARLVAQAVYIFSVVVACVLAVFCRRPTPVPRSTGCAGEDNVARTSDESEKSTDIVSDTAIPSGAQRGSRLVTRLVFKILRGVRRWPNTFRLDYSALGQPIGPVTQYNSWQGCLGRPMKQTEPATCALVACTVAVEAMHRLVHELYHGAGTFHWKAGEPHELLRACQRKGIWEQGKGAAVPEVLEKIRELGGVPLANPPSMAHTVLPLISWQEHRWDDDYGLSPERMAKLLDCGPCVGRLWACPWYFLFDASRNDDSVYHGCGRSRANREESEHLYPGDVGSHAVVCFGYRFCGDQMHVLLLDNHSATGPWRWVDFEELDALYTITVECLDPPRHASTS
ncbi:hypothetical protein ACP70R_050207 [Stipagrostis hirtigluma subsp. patula]